MIHKKGIVIKSCGVQVTVFDILLNSYKTKALIGRASKQFNSLVSIEAHRKGLFLPEDEINGGYTIFNEATKEYFLCIAMYPEVIHGEVASNFSHMLECNAELQLTRDFPEADEFGNITRNENTLVTNVQVHIESKSDELKQYDVGKRPKNEYLVFSPAFDTDLLDSVIVQSGGKWHDLKITSYDYITYKGVVILTVETETRM